MRKISISLLAILFSSSLLAACSQQEVGTVGGAVAGGYAGSALTGGSTAGTIAGAVGGGYIGNQLTR